MWTWARNLFSGKASSSGSIAKERLQVVLIHDRASLVISPAVLEQLKNEVIEVIKKYVSIDEKSLDIQLNADQRTTTLVANIPIVKRKDEKQSA